MKINKKEILSSPRIIELFWFQDSWFILLFPGERPKARGVYGTVSQGSCLQHLSNSRLLLGNIKAHISRLKY